MARRPRPRLTPPDPMELVGEHLDDTVWPQWDAMSAADQQTMLDDVATWDIERMKDARAHVYLTHPDHKQMRPCLAYASCSAGAWKA